MMKNVIPMSPRAGRLWIIRARGDFAHFGGVPFGPERSTMLGPSRSAAVGILRSILGKYESRWEPESVTLHALSEVIPLAQNQIKHFGSRNMEPINTDERRTQRVWTFLRPVDLVIRARINLSPLNAGVEDSIAKFDAMIERRLEQGHRHRQPFFGIRECTAHLTLVENEAELPPLAEINQDYGLSFYDIDMDDPERPAYLAPMKIEHGRIQYPTMDAVRKQGIRYNLPRAVL